MKDYIQSKANRVAGVWTYEKVVYVNPVGAETDITSSFILQIS